MSDYVIQTAYVNYAEAKELDKRFKDMGYTPIGRMVPKTSFKLKIIVDNTAKEFQIDAAYNLEPTLRIMQIKGYTIRELKR